MSVRAIPSRDWSNYANWSESEMRQCDLETDIMLGWVISEKEPAGRRKTKLFQRLNAVTGEVGDSCTGITKKPAIKSLTPRYTADLEVAQALFPKSKHVLWGVRVYPVGDSLSYQGALRLWTGKPAVPGADAVLWGSHVDTPISPALALCLIWWRWRVSSAWDASQRLISGEIE